MAAIAIDFDKTIVDGEQLLPGAKEAISLLREHGHRIVIHSANNPLWIRRVLNNNDVRYDSVWEGGGKPDAALFIDDKGFRFTDWENDLDDILRILQRS